MTRNAIILRETLISMAINAAISIGFFFAFFGLAQPIPAAALGPDFLPQSFMVALMGCLIPGLLVRRHSGQPARTIVLRALLIAAVALAIAGGGALAICAAIGAAEISPASALGIKAAFGAALAAATTPIAVGAALRPAARAY